MRQRLVERSQVIGIKLRINLRRDLVIRNFGGQDRFLRSVSGYTPPFLKWAS
jgi:hypothetical protein